MRAADRKGGGEVTTPTEVFLVRQYRGSTIDGIYAKRSDADARAGRLNEGLWWQAWRVEPWPMVPAGREREAVTTPKPQPSPPSQQRESHAMVWGGLWRLR
jgi:hypothetical protein